MRRSHGSNTDFTVLSKEGIKEQAVLPIYYVKLCGVFKEDPLYQAAVKFPTCRLQYVPLSFDSRSKTYKVAFTVRSKKTVDWSAFKQHLAQCSSFTELAIIGDPTDTELIGLLCGVGESISSVVSSFPVRLITPIEVQSQGVYIHFFVHSKPVLRKFEKKFRKLGEIKLLNMQLTEVSFTDWLTPSAFRIGLTPDEYDLLRVAISRGYYDVPKKTTIEKLSKSLGLSHSTLHRHLARISSRILASLTNDQHIVENNGA